MRNSTRVLQGGLIAALCIGAISCHKKDSVAPTDPALLGRWYLIQPASSYVVARPPLGVEFLAGSQVRHYHKDSLTFQGSFRHYCDKKVDMSGSQGLIEFENRALATGEVYLANRAYTIKDDTLYLNTPNYKGMLNCFPLYESYSRTPPVLHGSK